MMLEDVMVNTKQLLLTEEECKTIEEALSGWIDAAKTNSMMAGLFASALMSKDEPGESDRGKALREKMESSGETEYANRKRRAYKILAQLYE